MTANDRPRLGAILLAAGGSSRLGRPKQLLKFEGETLIRRAARSLAESIYFPIVVILGAELDASIKEISDLPVYTAVNEFWEDGMGSSIRTGLEKLQQLEPKLDGVLITLCDQPKISREVLERFATELSESKASAVVSAYDGVTGVPALLSNKLFDELSKLSGDKGAREILRGRQDVIEIDLPEAAIDIDTQTDVVGAGIETIPAGPNDRPLAEERNGTGCS